MQVTDVGLSSLSGLSEMATLDIAGCVAVTERGIAALALGFPNLQTLKVTRHVQMLYSYGRLLWNRWL